MFCVHTRVVLGCKSLGRVSVPARSAPLSWSKGQEAERSLPRARAPSSAAPWLLAAHLLPQPPPCAASPHPGFVNKMHKALSGAKTWPECILNWTFLLNGSSDSSKSPCPDAHVAARAGSPGACSRGKLSHRLAAQSLPERLLQSEHCHLLQRQVRAAARPQDVNPRAGAGTEQRGAVADGQRGQRSRSPEAQGGQAGCGGKSEVTQDAGFAETRRDAANIPALP